MLPLKAGHHMTDLQTDESAIDTEDELINPRQLS